MHRSRLESLTFLRFIAAIGVAIYHYGKGGSIHAALPGILTFGPAMVTFFFVLSGFVLAVSQVDRDIKPTSFYINRVARIWPIYLLGIGWIAYLPIKPMNMEGAFLSIFMLQSWATPYPLTGNGVGWSLSVEAFFYAVTPVLLVLAAASRSTGRWMMGAMVVWSLTQLAANAMRFSTNYPGFPSALHDIIYYFPPMYLGCFLLGFATGIAYKNGFLSSVNEKAWSIIFLIACAVPVVAYPNIGAISKLFGFRIVHDASFFAILFVPVVYSCAMGDRYLCKVMALRPFVILGEASYSMYILQTAVYYQILSWYPVATWQSKDLLVACYLGSLMLVSIAAYYCIEKPICNLVKRKKASVPSAESAAKFS